jgi:predicted nucleic acid-binding protein
MATYLLDTNIIIDVLNSKNSRESLLEFLVEQGHILACCSINVAEVYAAMKNKEEELTQTILKSLEYLEINREIAREGGLFKRDYARKGINLTLEDTIIAAVAIYYGCTLITDNVKHFPMKELTLYPISH